jgi:hypothetical protein
MVFRKNLLGKARSRNIYIMRPFKYFVAGGIIWTNLLIHTLENQSSQ